jgi:hypothetical protein
MSVRLLVTACDWRLLSAARASFSDEDYDVMVESSPEKALTVAKSWQPHVIVLSSILLARWDRRLPNPVEEWFPRTKFVVTVQFDDDGLLWEQLFARGFELLPLPLLHPGELVSAVASAATEPTSSGSWQGDGPARRGDDQAMLEHRPGSEMRKGTA